jgi:hypothetical protein
MAIKDHDLSNLKASNGDLLQEIGPMKSSRPDLPIEELRKRYEEDGYLWVRHKGVGSNNFLYTDSYSFHSNR